MAKLTQLQGNLTLVSIGSIKLYFSYETIIAFVDSDGTSYVSENVWTNTTGKHLNAIDNGNKKGRIPHEEFKQKLEYIQARFSK